MEEYKSRSVRVSDTLWSGVKKKAKQEANLEISEAIRLLMQAYLDGEIVIEKVVRSINKRPGPRQ